MADLRETDTLLGVNCVHDDLKTEPERHSLEYKKVCVEKALASGNVSSTARTLGIHPSVLASWVHLTRLAKIKGMDLSSSKEDSLETQKLRRDMARLKMENEILKKATAYFSQGELRRSMP